MRRQRRDDGINVCAVQVQATCFFRDVNDNLDAIHTYSLLANTHLAISKRVSHDLSEPALGYRTCLDGIQCPPTISVALVRYRQGRRRNSRQQCHRPQHSHQR